MTGGNQEQQEPKAGERRLLIGNHNHESFTKRNKNHHQFQTEFVQQNKEANQQEFDKDEEGTGDSDCDDEEEDEFSSEALLAVSSAEEYAAKITKLQQACLTPLKEDLADWLNKIMNMSNITTENFMDKLDNGVIICRLAKIISLWCEQQITNSSSDQYHNASQQDICFNNRASSQMKLESSATITSPSYAQNESTAPKLSISTLNVHTPTGTHDETLEDVLTNHDSTAHNHGNKVTTDTVIATPSKQYANSRLATFANGSLRSSSQSTNCLTSSSATSLNAIFPSTNQFLNNLTRMHQTKIWEEAKCRTFYARDNVCNFIKWSKEFGVNQSVLFESDDLVLHANPRQVVLCLLDVARIACVKHGFTEAPGLVKFEQEIDRELAAAAGAIGLDKNSTYGDQSLSGDKHTHKNGIIAIRKNSSPAKSFRSGSIVDATDELIMRYCLHKEEEAAKKKAAELEATAKLKAEEEVSPKSPPPADVSSEQTELSTEYVNSLVTEALNINNYQESTKENLEVEQQNLVSESDSSSIICDKGLVELTSSKSGTDLANQKNTLCFENRVDSLDSGEGRTESASTSNTSRTPVNPPQATRDLGSSMIPMAIKRSSSSSSLTSNRSSSIGTPSKLSSSRSSLLSGQESCSTTKHHITSDLDGKVMRIAKSYYGKGATKGVTRLSEGKYKIADRIVFVRLLKGHRVMVRIGGGWDTLENFLFRHKSDPSQVIDVDNLLPLETKMSFEKTPQATPTNTKFSKLPYYRRSSSASSTNLSVSNLSVSNHSPSNLSTTSTTTTNTNSAALEVLQVNQDGTNMTQQAKQHNPVNKQIPYLLIHRGQNLKTTPQTAYYNGNNNNNNHINQQYRLDSPQLHQPNQPHSREPFISNQRKTSSNLHKFNNRPIGSSKTPTASSTNLYPATLTTRLGSANIKTIGSTKLNSTTNLLNGRTLKQEAFRKLGRSNDSLQASYYKSPLHRQHQQNGSSYNTGGNLSAKRKVESHRKSSNGLVRQPNTNSTNGS